MLRSNRVLLVAFISVLAPLSASADKVDIAGSDFVFLHAPVDPTGDGFCVDPPGLLFNVTSDIFSGTLVTKKASIPFVGIGDATGCVFFPPIDGVAAEFEGSFTWLTAEGELRGTFVLQDFPTVDLGVFAVVIFIKFDGGTGKFRNAKGDAIAEGFDFPFGGLGLPENPLGGIVAQVTEGELKLKE